MLRAPPPNSEASPELRQLGEIIRPMLERQFLTLALLQHHGMFADGPDHRQIVGHQHQGESALFAQIAQQPQDAGLYRDIERRDRLVGNENRGLDRQRARDADALALSAA